MAPLGLRSARVGFGSFGEGRWSLPIGFVEQQISFSRRERRNFPVMRETKNLAPARGFHPPAAGG